MRWLSVGAHYAHEVVGGTQIYVHRLNLALRRRHVDAVGAYFTDKPGSGSWEGVPLIGLPMPPLPTSRRAFWECVPHGIDDFERLLADLRPDVVHFHATLQVHPPEYFEVAHRAGARTLWTFHAPGQSCLQSALLRNGHIPCDGWIDPGRCTRCGLIQAGIPRPVAAFFGAVDLSALTPLVPRGLMHPFERRRGVIRFRARLQQARDSLDHWVTHARWVRELLELNGLARSVDLELPLPPPEAVSIDPDWSPWQGLPQGLRLLFAGRLQDVKGPHLAVKALSGPLHGEDVALVLIAPYNGTPFEAQLRALVEAEPRARLLPSRDLNGTMAAMASADAIVVPSYWMETGPYTVLEAQWTGAPVLGANRSGIAERLEGDTRSALFQPNDVNDLARAIRPFFGRREAPLPRRKRAKAFQDSYSTVFDAALSHILTTVGGWESPVHRGFPPPR